MPLYILNATASLRMIDPEIWLPMTPADRLDTAFEAALRHYQAVLGQTFEPIPRCQWIETSAFWAVVTDEPDGYLLRVTTGLVDQVTELWRSACADDGFLAGAGQPVDADADQLIHLTLAWLMLHELQHVELNHFDLAGQSDLAETRNAPSFEIASREPPKHAPMLTLPEHLQSVARFCLELQADHDASEILLERYSPDEWVRLRQRIMAVSAMVMLIEREDAKNGQRGKTHPKAATRIFQLLGHVTELPLIPAQLAAHRNGTNQIDPADIVSPEEQAAYGKYVTIPSFFDAVHLARIANAESITQDLGDPTDFFKDIATAKIGSQKADPLRTEGAREWSKFVASNAAILRHLSA